MAGELGDRERRYVEAYLELESHSASARAGLRERIVAAALADEEEPEERAAARGLPRGAWVAAGLGLCAAAAALAWWVGRASLVEEHATRVHDQAPLVSEGERAVHEASARRGMASGPARTPATTAEASAEGTLAVEPQPAASPAARVETTEPPAAVRRTEAEPGAVTLGHPFSPAGVGDTPSPTGGVGTGSSFHRRRASRHAGPGTLSPCAAPSASVSSSWGPPWRSTGPRA